jgi:Ran GTPase-activating protein (RanGAP) involved in mRNA processing and transport/ankyrin repeat protein
MHPSSKYQKKEQSSSIDQNQYSGTNRRTSNSSSSQTVQSNDDDAPTAENAIKASEERTSLLQLSEESSEKNKKSGKQPVVENRTKDHIRAAYREKQGSAPYMAHPYIQAPRSQQIPYMQQPSAIPSSAQSSSLAHTSLNEELVYMQLSPAERIWDQLERLAQEEEDLVLSVKSTEVFWIALKWIREKNPNLISLTIDCAIGDNGAVAVRDVCQVLGSIRRIRLENTNIGPDGAQALSQLISENSALVVLAIVNNNIGPVGVQALADVLKTNNSLMMLDLENNNIGSEGTWHLSEALKMNTTLRVLSVFDNNIGEQGAKHLAKALEENRTLREIVAYDNNIGAVGAAFLAQALERNSSLIRLAIGKNNIGDEGAWALCEALKTNSTLDDLCIDTNNISDKGAKFLSKLIKINASLTVLVLSANPLGNKGMEILCNALKKNNTLFTLYLHGCHIDDESVPFIIEALEKNTSIDVLDVCGNKFTVFHVAELNAHAPRILCDTFKGPSERQYVHAVSNELRTGILKEKEIVSTRALPDEESNRASDHGAPVIPALVFPELPASAWRRQTFSEFLAASTWESIFTPDEVATAERMRLFFPGGPVEFKKLIVPQFQERALLKFLLEKRTSFEAFRDAIEVTGKSRKNTKDWFQYAIYNTAHSIDRRSKIMYLLTLDADPNEQHPLNGTALHSLVSHEIDEDDALFLIQQFLSCSHPLELDAKDPRGNTILMVATKVRSTQVAKFMVEKGADCTVCDKDERTPLHFAAILGNAALFDIFLEKNPEILHQKDHLDHSPLDYLVLPIKQREAIAEKLLLSVNIDPMRDENAIQNDLLDIDKSAITRKRVPFRSTKNVGDELLPLLEKAGAAACDNIDYGDESLAFIRAQIKRFSGKTLLSACMRQQVDIRSVYLKTEKKYAPHPSCFVLNQLMEAHDIKVKFKTRHKQHLPGFIDAVAALPIGVETAMVKRIREVLPKTMLMRHYENKGRQFFSVEHLQLTVHQLALKNFEPGKRSSANS